MINSIIYNLFLLLLTRILYGYMKTILKFVLLIWVLYPRLLLAQTKEFSDLEVFVVLDSDLKLYDSLQLWATYYYIPVVVHDDSGLDLLDEEEQSIGLKLAPKDWCKAAIEGTVHIQKDTSIYQLNYESRSEQLQYDCRNCPKYKNYDGYLKTGKVLWSKAKGFGKGVQNYQLVPFRSIAVDNSLIPYGSVLFIPEAQGVQYTDADGEKQTHDGLFFAADTGSKIVGNHIDVFLGLSPVNPFTFVKSTETVVFKAYLIENDKIRHWLLKMHQ